MRVEPLEQRTLLSAAPIDGLQRDLPSATPPPNWDIVICDDDGSLFGVDPDDMSPIFLNQGPRYEDIAFCPWEDVSFWGFYGVAWSPSAQTSFLYHFEVYTSGQTTVETGPGRAIRTSDGANVRLGALEFSDRGTLYAAGYRLGSNIDETFTIDLNTGVATHHQNLPAGYYSAGDIHFHRPDGSMYLTTQQAKLLKMAQPWSSPTPAFQIKPGDLVFGDFDGIGLDAPYLALGFRRAKGSTGQYGVYPIDLGSGSVNEGNVDWLGDVASLDNIRGAATRYSTAQADLSGAYFDVTPDPASAGTSVNVAFEVQNTGAKNAGPFDVAFYLSTDPNIGTGDKCLGTWSSDGVGALSTTERLTESLSLPALGDPFFNGTGTYYLGMIVDAGGQIVESNENDNSNTGQGLDYDALQIVVATLSIADVTVSPEGNSGTSDAVFTVQLSHATSLEVTVDYATADGTAAAGTDYDGKSGTLTFPPNQTQQTIRVPVRGDTLDEIDEGFFVNLSNAAHAVIDDGQGAGTIVDDDPPPTVSIDDATVTEHNSGTTEAVFTVTLSGASGKVVEVDYATADGTALDGKDYEATSSPPPLRFEPGQTQQEIRVPVRGDALDEIDEDFFVNLSGAVNAVIGDGQGQATILDDDAPPALSIGNASVDPEGDQGQTDAVFTVSLAVASGKTVTVDYTTADGTATAGDDYVATSGTLTFLPGQRTLTIAVPVTGDTLYEPDENFFVRLSSPSNATIDNGSGEGTIVDDDLTTVSIDDVTVDPEGNVIRTNAIFTVTLSAPSDVRVIVDYATADGTAKAGDDYTSKSRQLIFQPSETAKAIYVGVVGDAMDEPDENFFVRLSNPTGATIGDGEGEATIIDDDPPPAASVDDVTITEGDSGTTDAVFTVSLSAASGKTVTVSYATIDGTAMAGLDYVSKSGTLTFLPAETAKTIRVPVVGDTLDEPDELFFIDLSNGINVTLPGDQGQGTITDDDAPPTLSIDDVTVDPEGNSGTTDAIFTVGLSTASGRTVTVNYATANDTAMAGDDYLAQTGTLTFQPGEMVQTIPVPVFGDTLEEAAESFLVQLSSPVGATLADDRGQATIIDDDAPRLSISDVTVDPEGNAGTTHAQFQVSLSAASTRTVTVDFATADGTATAGVDYLSKTGTITFVPGELSKTILVSVLGDMLSEADETFFVHLSNPAFGVIEDGQGQGTIVDDDPLPTLSIGDVTLDPEGTGTTTDVLFTVSLSAASGATVTVDYTTADGTATAGDDYLLAARTLSIPPGTTQQTISVSVVGDALNELDETFFVNLSGAVYATIDDDQGQGTIVDDDPPPTLSIDDVTVAEGDSGSTDAVFTVSLSAASGQVVSVVYTTADGTAEWSDDDYSATLLPEGVTLSFQPGEQTKTIEVPVLGDTREEADETFFVNLASPTNATLADDQGQATILDDDRPMLSISDVILDPEGDEGTSNAIFTVTLLPAGTKTVTVDYATADGTAVAGDDYEAISGTLTFDPGQTQQTIEVPVVGDTLSEEDETFFVNLSNAAGADLADGQGQGTIVDDDAAPLAITYLELVDQDPSRWYPLQTTREGLLTVELTTDSGELALHDDRAEPPLATGRRIDWPAAAAGETYFLKITGTGENVDLRLANLVSVSSDGTRVTVHGTDGSDAFAASFAASPYVLNVKDLSYPSSLFPSATTIQFHGEGGADDAVVTGSDGNEQITLSPHSGTVTGPDYELQLTDFSSITVHAEGGDNTVTLFDSTGNDNYVAAPRYAAMYGDGYDNRAHGVKNSYAEAGDGVDVAKFYDSPGSDLYVASPTYNAVSGDDYENAVRYFEGVHVYATAGGVDVAKFYDSPGDDQYVATPTYAALFNDQYQGEHNTSFYNRAKFFEGVHAYATAGGSDLARFYDSPANDDFVATPTYAALYNSSYQQEYTHGFYNRAKYFEGAHAYATAGGSDLARLYDSPEDDVFHADPIQGALYNNTYEYEYTHGFYNRAKFFEGVHAYATAGGADEARLHGSGSNDKFYADAAYGAMYLPGEYYNRAKFFERVYADAHEGDGDQAKLSGLEEIGPEEGWDKYSDPGGSVFYWLSEFEEILPDPPPPGQGDQQGVGNKSQSLAVDFVLENEGLGAAL